MSSYSTNVAKRLNIQSNTIKIMRRVHNGDLHLKKDKIMESMFYIREGQVDFCISHCSFYSYENIKHWITILACNKCIFTFITDCLFQNRNVSKTMSKTLWKNVCSYDLVSIGSHKYTKQYVLCEVIFLALFPLYILVY